MKPRPFPFQSACLFALLVFVIAPSLTAIAQVAPPSDDVATSKKMFSEAPFEKWEKQGPAREIPWKISATGFGLSFHQRLVSRIEVELPGSALIKRKQDGSLTLLLQVTDANGRTYRNFGVLELETLKPELVKSDVVFSWGAYALPGEYKVEVAVYDKKSGEHDFAETGFHVDKLKNDPLPEAWNDEPAWEYWDPQIDSVDSMFRPDVDGKLHMPVKSAKPLHVEVLADLTPSDYFHGSYDNYNVYLRGALPIFKAFSQLSLENGSLQTSALDLVQRRVTFSQDQIAGQDFDWKKLKSTLESANGPGVVNVRNIQHGGQNPVFLRDEIVRRMGMAADRPGEEVFIVVGSPMNSYSFDDLPPLYMAEARDVRVYYIQFIPPAVVNAQDNGPRIGVPGIPHVRYGHRNTMRDPVYVSSPANVQKMLKPLKVNAFQVSSPEEARKVIARILEELRRQ